MNPLISVVIPAYNCADTLEETLQSVLNQTYDNLEIIVSCNNCKDNTVVVAQRIADTSNANIVVINSSIPGAAPARNRGVAVSKGEFIAYLDADDTWTVNKLTAEMEALRANPQAVVAYSLTTFVNEKGGFLFNQEEKPPTGQVLEELVVRNFLVCGSMCLVRRSAVATVGAWDEEMLSTHDWDYWIRLAEVGEFVLVPEYNVRYRQSATNITSNVERRVKYCLMCIDKTFDRHAEFSPRLKRKALGNAHLHFAVLYRSKRYDAQKAAVHYSEALRNNPDLAMSKTGNKLLLWMSIQYVKQQVKSLIGRS